MSRTHIALEGVVNITNTSRITAMAAHAGEINESSKRHENLSYCSRGDPVATVTNRDEVTVDVFESTEYHHDKCMLHYSYSR